MLDALVIDLRDVQERLIVGQDLHERTKVHDATYDAFVDLTRLRLCRQTFNDLDSAPHALRIRSRNVHGAVVLNVHCATGLLSDALDGLATGANDDANLIRFDLDGGDTRCP